MLEFLLVAASIVGCALFAILTLTATLVWVAQVLAPQAQAPRAESQAFKA